MGVFFYEFSRKFLVNPLPLPAIDTLGNIGFQLAVPLPPHVEAFQKKLLKKTPLDD